MPRKAIARLATWEVVIGHWGKMLMLRYDNRDEAWQTYERISKAMDEWKEFRNSEPTVHAMDLYGTHTFAMNDLKSVSIVEIEPAVRISRAYEKAYREVEGSEASPPVEAEATEVPQPEPEA